MYPFFLVLLMSLFGLSCSEKINEPEILGHLTIYYHLNDYDLPTVIWLEDSQGNYVKTLMVGEWLSYDGHRYPNICPDWTGVADWENVSKSEIDAVTAATPQKGKHSTDVDCENEGLSQGTYRYLVETHIDDEYNVLYSGEIIVGSQSDSDTAQVAYIPEKYSDPTRADVLDRVHAAYDANSENTGEEL